jgi:hypothetical protein
MNWAVAASLGRMLLVAAITGLLPGAWAQEGASTAPQAVPLTAESLKAAERLFDLPAYRQLATSQLYRALESLPDAQYSASVEALKDPQVVQALRGVIARSMAQAYTVMEMEFMGRVLATQEAQSIVAKSDLLQSLLTRELLAAALTNPDLARILTGQ